MSHPKVFISYAWEDEPHKLWVKNFADRLLADGVDTYLDQYDLSLGARLPQYMETSIADADFVLVICTPTYKDKSDKRKGGVGYEGHIISAELLTQGNEKKFIPVIRKGTTRSSLPSCLAGKLSVNLSDGNQYEEHYQDLLSTLLGVKQKPPVRPRIASTVTTHSFLQKDKEDDGPIRILGIITDAITAPKMDGSVGSALYKVPFRLSRKPSSIWKTFFLDAWNDPPVFSSMHRFKIASVYGDIIMLDGTTLEEVKQFHKETLIMCVNIANEKEAEYIKAEERRKKAEEKRVNEYLEKVKSMAEEIKF